MIPANSPDIIREYEILLNELKCFNPELLHKKRVLAISKTDLIDDITEKEINKNLPDIPHVFISSVTGRGLNNLKDILWNVLNL